MRPTKIKKNLRTDEEIQKKIKELVDDEDNFTSDNYGSESADNGFFEVYYSEYNAEETFNKFVEWLFNKKEKWCFLEN